MEANSKPLLRRSEFWFHLFLVLGFLAIISTANAQPDQMPDPSNDGGFGHFLIIAGGVLAIVSVLLFAWVILGIKGMKEVEDEMGKY